MAITLIDRGPVARFRNVARRAAWEFRWGWDRYPEYYRRRMDRLASLDPRAAVGGMWEDMGRFQLQVLQRLGLQPEHRLLDIGCGALRGGLQFIRYLEAGNYVGLEASPSLLKAGERYLKDDGLGSKRPELLHTSDFSFREVEGRTFDYLLAFGVFTDLPGPEVRDCLLNLPRIMHAGSIFAATYMRGPHVAADPTRISFRYPWWFFESLADESGLSIAPVDGLNHPKGHSILQARLSA
ncbi:MAG: methyltransferase domain-containing protein [Chloroflexi bacterium]|nr:methyltransferase domain-containing protein [Chloroflexota bacterium]